MSIPEPVLARLKDAVGAKGFSTDAGEIAPHLEEWRSKYHGHSPLLLKPATTAEVSAILAICNETATPLVTVSNGHTFGKTFYGDGMINLAQAFQPVGGLTAFTRRRPRRHRPPSRRRLCVCTCAMH